MTTLAHTVNASPHRPSTRDEYGQTRDLQIWRNAVTPYIIDWAGILGEPFAVHTQTSLISSKLAGRNFFKKYLLTMLCRLWYVPRICFSTWLLLMLSMIQANSAIRNWRNSIGKHVAYQRVITKTDNFYGCPAGALSLCAATVSLIFCVFSSPNKFLHKHEHALKLWRNGSAPTWSEDPEDIRVWQQGELLLLDIIVGRSYFSFTYIPSVLSHQFTVFCLKLTEYWLI